LTLISADGVTNRYTVSVFLINMIGDRFARISKSEYFVTGLSPGAGQGSAGKILKNSVIGCYGAEIIAQALVKALPIGLRFHRIGLRASFPRI
jgi:hypothetical protein